MNTERWLKVPDCPFYEISNLGRVRSVKFNKERILKSGTSNAGYSFIVLSVLGERKQITIHQLMAIVFLNHKPCGHKLVVNHKNFIRTDNRIENLELVTQRENSNQKHFKSSSKYTGVSWDKEKNKWKSALNFKGTKTHLGYFDNEIDAGKCYDDAVKCINENRGYEIKFEHAPTSSKYKGVSWDKTRLKWKSYTRIDGKQVLFGRFKTELEAHLAYQKALNNI